MDYAWLENGEYWIQVEDMRTSIMRDAITAKTEAQTAEAFQRQLYYFVRLHTGIELDFKQETPIKGGLTHDFGILKNRTSGRGRLDAVVNNLIIEYKKHSKLEKKNDQDTATNQVKDYLKTLFTNDGVKYNAILTDGIKISYFGFNGEKIESTAFKNIEAKDIDRIIRAILTNNCKKFIPENVLKDFAVNSETNSISKELACELYQKLIVNPTDKTNMLFSEWESLMHLSFDDNGKGNDIEKDGYSNHRKNNISLVFQNYNLIDYLTPIENVRLVNKNASETILFELGLDKSQINRNVMKLSGGQQQRVAIARALVSEAPIILADEPTGNLDVDTAGEIIEILKKLAKERNKCVIVVTHSKEVANSADIILELRDRKLKKINN